MKLSRQEIGKYEIRTEKNEAGNKSACEIYEMSDLSEKDFSVAIINIFTELKESMIKVKEGVMTMSHQTKNISEEIKKLLK